MAARTDLKIAIIKSHRTQRRLSLETKIPEIRLSKIVCGFAWPRSTERAALAAALGEDHFAELEIAEARSR